MMITTTSCDYRSVDLSCNQARASILQLGQCKHQRRSTLLSLLSFAIEWPFTLSCVWSMLASALPAWAQACEQTTGQFGRVIIIRCLHEPQSALLSARDARILQKSIGRGDQLEIRLIVHCSSWTAAKGRQLLNGLCALFALKAAGSRCLSRSGPSAPIQCHARATGASPPASSSASWRRNFSIGRRENCSERAASILRRRKRAAWMGFRPRGARRPASIPADSSDNGHPGENRSRALLVLLSLLRIGRRDNWSAHSLDMVGEWEQSRWLWRSVWRRRPRQQVPLLAAHCRALIQLPVQLLPLKVVDKLSWSGLLSLARELCHTIGGAHLFCPRRCAQWTVVKK